MKERAYNDIKPALIEAGFRARELFGYSLDSIRRRALDYGVTLTWSQESDVLLSVQEMCRRKRVETASGYQVSQESRDEAGGGTGQTANATLEVAGPPKTKRIFLAEAVENLQ